MSFKIYLFFFSYKINIWDKTNTHQLPAQLALCPSSFQPVPAVPDAPRLANLHRTLPCPKDGDVTGGALGTLSEGMEQPTSSQWLLHQGEAWVSAHCWALVFLRREK